MQNDYNNGNNRTDVLAAPAAHYLSNSVGYYPEEDDDNFNLRDYWHVLKKRKWLALSILAGALAIAFLVNKFTTPVWEGRITLQITQEKASSATGKADVLGGMYGYGDTERFYRTQYAILHSFSMAYGLIEALKLQEQPAYKALVKALPQTPPGVIRQIYAGGLLSNLTITPVAGSYLVEVAFRSRDKMLAQKIPAAVQSVYINFSMKTRQQSFSILKEWLDDQLLTLGNKLQYSENKSIVAGQKNDLMGMDTGGSEKNGQSTPTNIVLQKYVQIAQLLTTSQANLAGKKALVEEIEKKGADASPMVNNSAIASLRATLASLESKATGSGQIYGPKFPGQKVDVATAGVIQKRLNAEIKRQAGSVKSDYQAALKTEKLLQKEFDDAKAKLVYQQNGLAKLHMLKRDLATNQALYEGLLGRMKDAAVAATMVPSNIAVINASEPPLGPCKPNPLRNYELAFIIGSLLGVGVVFLIEYLDSSIKTADELEKLCHIPSLGVIPMVENGAVPKTALETITHFEPKSQISEAVSHIRSGIMLSGTGKPPQVILVTSCNPKEGKSTSTCNIAISLSRGGRKCLIIDCDLRKPRLHRVFKHANKRGLTNYLTGSATLEEVIMTTEIPNLYFMPAGPTPPSPDDLISSELFSKMIEALRKDFEHVVIDSPPIIGFADARSLSVVSDGVLLVFKHHTTSRESAKLAVQMLSHNNSPILGSILTMAKKEQLGYGAYYSYYRYYNKYYEAYSASDAKALKEPSKGHDRRNVG